MYSNIKIKKEIMDMLRLSVNSLDNMDNIVPYALKRTFNFKGRKSVDIAAKLIKVLSNSESIVGDPFAGSGSFALACAKEGVKTICSELDNYTFEAVRVLFQKYDIKLFNILFDKVRQECYNPIMELYSTECCETKNFIDKLHFDPETDEYYNPTPHRDIKDNKSIILLKSCPICGEKRKIFEKIDELKIQQTYLCNTIRFPSHKLIENSRINITTTSGADSYNRNFTNRAKCALLMIQDNINSLPPSFERDILENCLVASLALARISQYGSGTEYLYQVMRIQAQEKNVWMIFEDKCNNFVRFKKEFEYAQVDNICDSNSKLQLYIGDYRELFNQSKYAGYFDIIYTDPPYTDQVAYLERSQMFRDWLNTFYYYNNFKLTQKMLDNEMVITNAPIRINKQGYDQYYSDINQMFIIFNGCLKKDGIVVLTLKLGENKYFKTLAEFINLARKNGFEYALKFGIDKNDPSLRKQAAYKNTISKEIIVFFVKLDDENTYWYVNNMNYDFEVVKMIYNKIKKTDTGYLLLTECVKNVQNDLLRKYGIISDEKIIQRIKKVLSEEFYIAPNTFVSIDPNRLYLEMEDSSDVFAKLYDTIPVLINKLNKCNEGFTLDDLYFEIINVICNGNPNVLNQILEQELHQQQIISLLDNYCDMEQNKYVVKKFANVITENSKDISSMDGYEFEELIKSLLAKEGFTDIFRVGGACDRGVDLYAKKVVDGKIEGYIFQCKRWLGNVGGAAIQRLHSMLMQMSPVINHAVCVTTSNYTSHALSESKNTGVGTINGVELLKRLNNSFPGEYHHAALGFLDNN